MQNKIHTINGEGSWPYDLLTAHRTFLWLLLSVYRCLAGSIKAWDTHSRWIRFSPLVNRITGISGHKGIWKQTFKKMILPVALICAITAATSTSMDALPAQELAQPDSGMLNFSEARMLWSNCRGKRLDALTLYKHITPGECIEMGGDCCAINADGIGNGSDDPRTMSSDKCYGCYNSTIKVKCTGKLVRSQSGFFQDWWVNSKNCIKAGGLCCDGTKTSENPAIFDPNDYPNADFCLNCYSGPVRNTTEMDGIWEKVVTSCSGQLIANNDYKASTCTRFGGTCCDDDTSTNSNFGGNAFRASAFPDSRCNSCFTGEPKEIGAPLRK